jgi:heme-degrading monooxygenase HmoA
MFLVVFRNRKRADFDAAAYAADAARMEQLAAQQAGFLAFKSYTAADGEVVAISEWADAQSARAWGAQAEHAATQKRGRDLYYQDYTLYTCDNPRSHHFDRDDS